MTKRRIHLQQLHMLRVRVGSRRIQPLLGQLSCQSHWSRVMHIHHTAGVISSNDDESIVLLCLMCGCWILTDGSAENRRTMPRGWRPGRLPTSETAFIVSRQFLLSKSKASENVLYPLTIETLNQQCCPPLIVTERGVRHPNAFCWQREPCMRVRRVPHCID
jgi:hypothetical protein